MYDTIVYLTRRYQIKRVQKEKTQGLYEEHIVAVFPHQEERDAHGTHGKIAKHLQEDRAGEGVIVQRRAFMPDTITHVKKDTPQWQS